MTEQEESGEWLERMEELYVRFQEQEKLQHARKHSVAVKAKRFLHFIHGTGEYPAVTAGECEKFIRARTLLKKISKTARAMKRDIKTMSHDLEHQALYVNYMTFALDYEGSPDAEDFAFRHYMQTQGNEPDFTIEQAQDIIAYARARRGRAGGGSSPGAGRGS